jgi:hypothetical protein
MAVSTRTSVVFEQWDVIGAQVAGFTLTGNGSCEHAARGDAVDITSSHAEANDLPSKLIHDNQHSMCLEQYRLAPEHINAP